MIESHKKNSIAIIGMACRFPEASNYSEFWENLLSGKNSVQEIPISRWDTKKHYSSDFSEPNKSISKWCALLKDIELFDAKYFGISAREAKNIDPQQRLLLEETVHCVEDSGLPLAELQKKTTGVYIGAMAMDYLLESTSSNLTTDSYACLGNFECILANRLSYFFDFSGPSFSVDAACASSLASIEQARLALQSNDIDYAIAGGVSLNFHPWKYISFSKSRMLSPRGQCRTFDRDADGYVPGEGVGVLLLQRLELAEQDNNHIHGVILGGSVRHGGKSESITSPSVSSQQSLITKVFRSANVNPETVTYIEAHGTGTSLGDPIEVTALNRVFKQWTNKKSFCYLGSVKSNIGHLEAAAGIAGLMKILLMMKHKKIVPTLNVSNINPILPIEDSAFNIPFQCKDWEVSDSHRFRAGISSFGFGGTISHYLLESAKIESKISTKSNDYLPFVISAKSERSLNEIINKWKGFINDKSLGNVSWFDICATLATGRNQEKYRWGCYVKNLRELKYNLYESNNKKIFTSDSDLTLIVNPRPLSGFKEISNLFSKDSFLYEKWNSLNEKIKNESILNNIDFEFFKEKWPQRWCNVNAFITNYLYLDSLIFLGFDPKLIIPSEVGVWESLALSKMLSPIDIICILSNRKELSELKFNSPLIPFYDPVNKKIISLYNFNDTYITDLIGGLNIFSYSWGKYLNEAIELKNTQYTFKSYLQEWDRALGAHNIKIDDLFTTMKLSEKESVLQVLVIQTSLIKLYRKWNLSPKIIIPNPHLNELTLLLSIFKLDKTDVVSLILGDLSCQPNLVKQLNLQSTHKLSREEFPLLYSIFSFPDSDMNIDSWVDKCSSVSGSEIFEHHVEYLYFGDESKSEIKSNDNNFSILSVDVRSPFNESVFGLWKKGVSISWENLFGKRTFNKVPLPVYSFSGEYYWINEKNNENDLVKPEELNMGEKPNDNLTNIKCLSKKFSPYVDAVIKDTVVGKYCITPSPLRLELALLSGIEFISSSLNTLSEIYFPNPGIVTVPTEFNAFIGENGNFSIEKNDGDKQELLAKGKVIYKELVPSNPPDSNHSLITNIFSSTDIYSIFDQWGYHYGEEMKLIDRIEETKDFFMIHVKNPVIPRDNSNLDPFVLDCMFQGVFVVGHLLGDLFKNKFLYVPISINNLQLAAPLNDKCYVVIYKDAFNITKSNDINLSFYAYDYTGKPIVSVDKIYFHRVSRDFLSTLADDNSNEKENSKVDKSVLLHSPPGKLVEIRGKKTVMPNYNINEATPKIKNYLKSIFSELLCCQVDDIGDDSAFKDEHGVDSLVNQDVVARIIVDTGDLPKTLLFEYTTINQLTEYFIENHLEKICKIVGVEASNVNILDQNETDFDKLKLNKLSPHQFTNNAVARPVAYYDINQATPKIKNYLKSVFSQFLHCQIDDIGDNSVFKDEHGVDSLVNQDIITKMISEIGELPKTLLFEYITIDQLTEYFIENHLEKICETIGIEASSDEAPPEKNEIDLEGPGLGTLSQGYLAHQVVPRNIAEENLKPITANASSHQSHTLRIPKNEVTTGLPSSIGIANRDNDLIDESSSKEKENLLKTTNESIAIIGCSGVFPKSSNIDELWDNIKEGKNCITEVPQNRWNYSEYFAEEQERGKSYTKWGGFIDGFDEFDPLFFQITPKQAQFMDPQQRVFLQTAWNSIEDAGLTRKSLPRNTGVFVGVTTNSYDLCAAQNSTKENPQCPDTDLYDIANRVSYFCDLRGPSMSIDSACSSSLTSVHLAVKSLQNSECEMAIAGGVSLTLHPHRIVQFCQKSMLNKENFSHPFGKGTGGFIDAEGAAAIVLKPLSKALSDNDQIYALIKGTAINAGGRTSGYTVPNPKAHAELILKAVESAQISPKTISYIEAHGTGTTLGDPIEIEGLTKAFRQYTDDKQFCAIGSIKANIGHLIAAAGIAGLIKILLQLKHRKLAPSIHSQPANPNIDFSKTPFFVQQELRDWDAGYPRRAGVSSFGMGGSNAHVILEEYSTSENMVSPTGSSEKNYLIVISAKDKKRLYAYLQNIHDFVDKKKHTLNIADIAYTLQVGREEMEERISFVVDGIESLIEALNKILITLNEDKEKSKGEYKKQNSSESKVLIEYSCGNIKNNLSNVKHLIEGDAGAAFLNVIFQNKQIQRLAPLWVSGVQLNWNLLYNDGQLPNKISLPTYPFYRDKYWLPKNNGASTNDAKTHPLLGSIDASASIGLDQGILFSNTIYKNDWFVKEHCVRELSVLPGVAYLEMAWAAAILIGRSPEILSDFVWQAPLSFDNECLKKDIKISLMLSKSNEDNLMFSVFTYLDTYKKLELMTGELYAPIKKNVGSSNPLVNIVDWKNIKTRCIKEIDNKKLYEQFSNIGLQYGPSFQGVSNLWVNDNEAIGHIELPPPQNFQMELFDLHPSIMDAALQVGLSLFLDEAMPHMPFAVEKMTTHAPLSRKMIVYAKKITTSATSKRCDVQLVNERGELCLAIQRVEFREIKDHLDKFFYVPEWVHVPAKKKITKDIKANLNHTLLILTPPKEWSYCVERLSADIKKYHLDSTVIELPVDDISQLKTDHIDEIYFLGGLLDKKLNIADSDVIDSIQRLSVYALYQLVKFLSVNGFDEKKLKLKVITSQTNAIDSKTEIYPWVAGLSGLTRTLIKEHPLWEIVGLAVNPIDINVEDILSESRHSGLEEISFHNGKRYERKLTRAYFPPISHSHLKNEGVYLIAGGLGGIGQQLCEYLAQQVKARLIIIGRSKKSSSHIEKIQRIENSGGQVIYLNADITDYERLNEVVDQGRKAFGSIDGIFNSTIVLSDGAIDSIADEDFQIAYDIKVKGSINLYRAVENDTLDFMVFFSSILSIIGNPGQGNYIAGGTFQDAFSHYLNRQCDYPVHVVNWGYWGTVGIVATENYENRLNNLGMYSISPKEGMESVERILFHGPDQVVVVKADDKLRNTMGVNAQQLLTWPMISSSISLNKERLRLKSLCSTPAGLLRFKQGYLELEDFARQRLYRCFLEMDILDKSTDSAKNLPNSFSRFHMAALRILNRPGTVINDGVTDWQDQYEYLKQTYPEVSAHLELLVHCFESYSQILRREVLPTEVIFPESSIKKVEGIYKGNPSADYFNELAAQATLTFIESSREHLQPGEKIRILEIGAGTGGTSKTVLNAIGVHSDCLEYVYTDVSNFFLLHGRKHFSEQYKFINFKTLDITKDPISQDFSEKYFDVVIATNVLHATPNIEVTLKNIRKLFKPNGWLVLNEMTGLQDVLTLTFGLLDGWWLFEDEKNRLQDSPLIDTTTWCELLRKEGFNETEILAADPLSNIDLAQSVLVSQYSGVVRRVSATQKSQDNQNQSYDTISTRPASLKTSASRTVSNTRKSAKVKSNRLLTKSTSKTLIGRDFISEEVNEEVSKSEDFNSDNLESIITDLILNCVEKTANIPANDIDEEKPFSEYGIDSITGIDLIKSLNDELGISLSKTALFDYSNVISLMEHVLRKYNKEANLWMKKKSSVESSHAIPKENSSINKVDEPDNMLKETLSSEKLEQLLLDLVLVNVEVVSGISAENIDEEQPFSEYGIDSITGIELVKSLNEELNVSLSKTALFDYSNVIALTEFLLDKYSEEVNAWANKKHMVKPQQESSQVYQRAKANQENSQKNKTIENDMLSQESLEQSLLELVLINVESTAGIPADNIDDEKPFSEYGIDSITGIELVKSLNDELGISLSKTALFDYSNVVALTEFLLDKYSEEVNAWANKKHMVKSQQESSQVYQRAKINQENNQKNKTIENDMLSQESLEQSLLELVLINVESTAGIPAGNIDDEKPFSEYGIDSITGIELVKSLNDELGISLSKTALFDYSNVVALTEFLLDKYSEEVNAWANKKHIVKDQQESSQVYQGANANQENSQKNETIENDMLDPERLEQSLLELVLVKVEATAGIPAGNIDDEKPFSEYGIDSITGIELVKSLNDELGISLSKTALFDYSNVILLTEYLFEKYNKQVVSWGRATVNLNYNVSTGYADKNELTSTSLNNEKIYTHCLHYGSDSKGDWSNGKVVTDQYYITVEGNNCLRDHVIYGQYIMPSDAYLEILYIGTRKLLGYTECLRVENFNLRFPMITQYDVDLDCQLMLSNKNANEFVIQSRKVGQSNSYESNVEGVFKSFNESSPINTTYKTLWGRGETVIEPYEIYTPEAILKVGPSYQTIQGIHIKGRMAVSQLRRTSEGEKLRDNFVLEPSIVDGLFATGLKFASFLSGDLSNFFIPVLFDQINIYRELPNDVYYGVVDAVMVKDSHIELNLALVDEQGNEAISFKGFHLQKIRAEDLKKNSGESTEKKKTSRKETRPVVNNKVSENVSSHRKPTRSDTLDSSAEKHSKGMGIAIIGMAGRFPMADSVDEFWHNLSTGRDSVTEVPHDRWSIDKYYDEDKKIRNKTYSKWGGFLSDIDCFDSLFFQISGKEAELSDPEHRVFLEDCWSTLENAGYSDVSISGKRVGVFVGAAKGDYQLKMHHEEGAAVEGFSFAGNETSVLAARISYFLNLKGPSLAVNTACSSSLVSINLACQSILAGESDMALAGGVHICTTPLFYILTSKSSMLSPVGQCRAFDNDANGFVPGEASAAILLKPLDKALNDRDHVYGVVRGIGVNQDGKTNGMTAPSSVSQTALEVEVYQRYDIDPNSISYIETHGTGTKLGDPIEIEALTNAFRQFTKEKQFCPIGSLKTNIGHAARSAGIASVIKILLSLKHKQIAPSLHCEVPNEYINFKDSPFYVNQKLCSWDVPKGNLRRAAVSSFGISGTNCHMVIDEAPALDVREEQLESCYLIPFSAKTEVAFKQKMQDFSDWLKGEGKNKNIGDIAYTLQLGRSHFSVRRAYVVKTKSELNKIINNDEFDPLENNPTREIKKQGKKLQKDFENLIEAKSVSENTNQYDQEYKEYLDEFVKLYENGYKLEWNLMYRPDHKYTRVVLPTYPFAKDKYWIPQTSIVDPDIPGLKVVDKNNLKIISDGISNDIVNSDSMELIHPLLDRVDYSKSLSEGLTYEKSIKSSSWIVNEHKVGGDYILPGAAYLEMAHAAFSKISTQPFYLSHVFWLQPLVVKDECIVQVVLRKEKEKTYFDVQTDENGIHGTGEICLFDDGREKLFGDGLSIINRMKKTSSVQISGQVLYETLKGIGVEHGEHYQCVNQIHICESEALAEVFIDRQYKDISNQYSLYPPLVDSCLQVAAAYIIKHEQIKNSILPYSVDEIEFIKQPTENSYVYLEKINTTRFNLTILSENGDPCIRLRDVFFQELKTSRLDFFYKPEWKSRPLSIEMSNKGNNNEGPVLFISPDTDVANKWKKKIAENYQPKDIWHISLGNQTQRVTDQHWMVSFEDPQGIENALKYSNCPTPNSIYFLGGMLDRPELDITNEDIAYAQKVGTLSLLRLLKSINSLRWIRQEIKICVLTLASHAVQYGERTNPLSAGIFGLAKTMRKEFPQLNIKCIDVLSNSPTHDQVLRVKAQMYSDEVREIALRDNNKRFVQVVSPIDLSEDNNQNENLFRNKGVYIILGGSGGIGVELSYYLAEKVQARIVWLGRSELNQEQKEKIRIINSKGGRVMYIQVDATNKYAMDKAVAQVKEKYGNIQGAIHSALVLKDKSLANMDEETFLAACEPKVEGSVNFRYALRNEKLDFFLFFSSGESFTCYPGQSNYASACTFKDAFAHYWQEKSEYPIKIINWGYWGTVGVVSNDDYNNQLAAMGVYSISPEEGMEIIEKVLGEDLNQLIPIKASREHLESVGVEFLDVDQLSVTNINSRENLLEDSYIPDMPSVSNITHQKNNDIKDLAVDYIKEVFSKTLKIDKSRINTQGDFSSYGMDSLVMIHILQEFEKDFGKLPPTLLYEKMTTEKLMHYLLDNHKDKFVSQLYGESIIEKEENFISNDVGIENRVVYSNQSQPIESIKKDIDLKIETINYVKRIFSKSLKVDVARISDNENFSTYGMDSLVMIHILQEFEKDFGKLSPTLLYEAMTTERLAQYLLENHSREIASQLGGKVIPERKVNLSSNNEIPPVNSFDHLIDNQIKSDIKKHIDLKDQAIHYVKKVFSDFLKVDVKRIANDGDFSTYGMDSLVMTYILQVFERDLGKLPATLLYEKMTAESLAEYFVENNSEGLKKLLGVEIDDGVRRETKNAYNKSHKSNDPISEVLSAPIVKNTNEHGKDIAVIGLSGRYPMANNIEKFWDNLKQGKSCISEIPEQRWNWRTYFTENKYEPKKIYSKWGGFIDDVDKFDPMFFSIPPNEADLMDPQERLFLQATWHLLEDAGYTREEINRKEESTGVFVGVMHADYEVLAGEKWSENNLTSAHSSTWSIANRISYLFDFHGPSLAVNTACSSALTAIHLAYESLNRGESTLAISGGVNLILHPKHYLRLAEATMMSEGQACRSFGANADGFVDGEGVGAVLLKPLQRAEEDRDNIYAVIKGSFFNTGGKTSGYTVPNPNAQAKAISSALRQSNIDPNTINYLEAHGTGTAMGDPIEISGLSQAYRDSGVTKNQTCAIGSVKSNLGHLESAAGVAGLSKILLQMRYGKLVPSLHADELNPLIDFSASPFYVQRELKEWERVEINNELYSRRAGLSSFGAGGTNHHLILEEYCSSNKNKANVKHQQTPLLFVLSAKSIERLHEYVTNFKHWLTGCEVNLVDLSYTLQVGREAMRYRLAIPYVSQDELVSKIGNWLQYTLSNGNTKDLLNEDIFYGKAALENTKSIEVNKNNSHIVAKQWVSGCIVNWGSFYINNLVNEVDFINPRRISIPLYPFQKDRCWIPELKEEEKNNKINTMESESSDSLKNNMGVNKKVRVAVIGAGPAGIASLKCLTDSGHDATLFEKTDRMGGVWVFRDDHKGGPYLETRLQTSKFTSLFSDFPAPESMSLFPNVSELNKYFHDYVDNFNLRPKIKFNTPLKNLKKIGDQWELTLINKDGVQETQLYDAVSLCTGHFWTPKVLSFSGLENFQGQQLHSANYHQSSIFKDKRVLIIGNGVSGMDIAVDALKETDNVTVSLRSKKMIIPRMFGFTPNDCSISSVKRLLIDKQSGEDILNDWRNSIPDHVENIEKSGLMPEFPVKDSVLLVNNDFVREVARGTIRIKPEITLFLDNGCKFEDGSYDDFDIVVQCTGYESPKYSFMTDIKVDDLYKHQFHPDYPNLSVMGAKHASLSVIPTLELEARWFSHILSNKCSLPSSDDMRVEIEIDKRKEECRGHLFPTIDSAKQNMWLAEQIGAYPDPVKNWKLYWRLLNLPAIPSTYRLVGPNSWSNAESFLNDLQKKLYLNKSDPKIEKIKYTILNRIGKVNLENMVDQEQISIMEKNNALSIDWKSEKTKSKNKTETVGF